MEKDIKLGQNPAFACVSDHKSRQEGISKRFYAACAAMQGLLSNDTSTKDPSSIIKKAYKFADELLEQE